MTSSFSMPPLRPVLLVVFVRGVARKLLWLCRELHRWVTALLMAAALGVDALMHMLHIPHLEGWWLPMLASGGAVASFCVCMLRTKRKTEQSS